jgi:16S rRNA C967 or C1407 C5-methylase (RsmB/RsmF family)
MNDQLEFKKGPSWLPPSYNINNSSIRGTGRFFPSKHNTIGFFVAKIAKRKSE